MANPIKSDYIAMGTGKGMKITLWPNSLQIERVEKDEKTNKWETKEKITLAPKILEYLGVRIPAFIAMMDAQKKE
jgi:hypothetical protein